MVISSRSVCAIPHKVYCCDRAVLLRQAVASKRRTCISPANSAELSLNAAKNTSWVGTCPGNQESAEENSSSRSAKGNKYMRRVLNQAAHAAARSKGTHFQAVFRRLLPRLGYKSAVWAIAHRLCRLVWKILHRGIRYVEQGIGVEPKLLIYRAQSLAKQLRKFGYNVQITPANRAPA